MENLNRNDFDVSYRIKLNNDTILKCISDLDNFKISNRNNYYQKCVFERFNKCNDNYVKEFDKTLEKIYNDLFDNNNNFDYSKFRKLLKESAKLTSDIYDKYIEIIYSLDNPSGDV